jgi:4-hydroxybutyryl-CoA dehydratase/vinylacetyl-CoA-Delta-isomerase
MTAVQSLRGRTVNRMLHINESAGDLLNKLEAVRILCQETGCAQRYLAHDALNAIHQVSARIDDARGSSEHRARFAAYLEDVQDARPVAGNRDDRRQGRPLAATPPAGEPDTYVHIVERQAPASSSPGPRPSSPARRTCTSSGHAEPQHEPADADFAVCCAIPVDAPGLTIVARPAGRPGEKVEHGAALFSRRYGQSTAVVIFERVFVPWERVFFAGEWEHSGSLTYTTRPTIDTAASPPGPDSATC